MKEKRFMFAGRIAGLSHEAGGTFLGVTLGFIFLQWLRPFFFLTDDNLSAWHPVMVEIGTRLLEGNNPFHNTLQYGGFDIRSDPGVLAGVNPLSLLAGLFAAATRLHWTAEIYAYVVLLLSAWAFLRLIATLQQHYGLALGRWTGLLIALSYTYNFYGLTVGASWVQFIGTQAALPVLLVGICEKDPKRSWKWLIAGAACNLWLGHLHPFLYSSLFLSVLMLALALVEKRVCLILRWGVSHAVVLLLTLPLLWPGYVSVSESARSDVVDAASASMGGLNVVAQIGSIFIAPLIYWSRGEPRFDELAIYSEMTLMTGLSVVLLMLMLALQGRRWVVFVPWVVFSGLAVYWIFGELLGALLCAVLFTAVAGAVAWWRDPRTTRLEWCLAGVLALTILFVHRPSWLADLIALVPVFKYLRWPFRECLLIVFLLHVLVCFGARFLPRKWFVSGMISGLAVVLLVLWVAGGPTLNLMPQDRRLILSGENRTWWEGNMAQLDDGRRWIPVMSEKDFKILRYDTPFCLLGAFNYASLHRVPSAIGYMGNWMSYKGDVGFGDCYHWSGLVSPERYAELEAGGKSFNVVRLDIVQGGLLVTATSTRGARTYLLPWEIRDPRRAGGPIDR